MPDVSIQTMTTKTYSLTLSREDALRLVRSHIYGLMGEKDPDVFEVPRGADAVVVDLTGHEDDFPTVRARLVVQFEGDEG